ncbi:MAG: hypothetical protein JXQ75_12860 [Phycisphaerae bacterium]|nr:hypothetical protein [Phycisphaerae bacterium]
MPLSGGKTFNFAGSFDFSAAVEGDGSAHGITAELYVPPAKATLLSDSRRHRVAYRCSVSSEGIRGVTWSEVALITRVSGGFSHRHVETC